MKTMKFIFAATLITLFGINSFASAGADKTDGGPDYKKSSESTIIFAPVFKTMKDNELSYYVIKIRGEFLLVDDNGTVLRDLGKNYSYNADEVYFCPVTIATSALKNKQNDSVLQQNSEAIPAQ